MVDILPTEMNATINGTKSYFDFVQSASDGSFFPIMLLSIFVIMFMIFKGGTTNGKAFVGSSFLCMILAMLLTTLGWLSSTYMYITIILTAIGAVWAYMDNALE